MWKNKKLQQHKTTSNPDAMNAIGGNKNTPIIKEEDMDQLPSGVTNMLVGLCQEGGKKPI
jgi:hypothetical protein